jgi:MOSC domain-containing protein YiiM
MADEAVRARVLQVNVSPKGGLPKVPVSGEVWIRQRGVEGDFNRFRSEKLHGDPDSAVLLLPIESIRAHASAGYPVGPGSMGENLTLEGVTEERMAPGQRWRVGGALLQISRACTPCNELDVYGTGLLKQSVGRRGWYARVLAEGQVRAGDAAVLVG